MLGLLLVVTARWTGRVKRTSMEENIFCLNATRQVNKLSMLFIFCCFRFCFLYLIVLLVCSCTRGQLCLYNTPIRFGTKTHHLSIFLCTHKNHRYGCFAIVYLLQVQQVVSPTIVFTHGPPIL